MIYKLDDTSAMKKSTCIPFSKLLSALHGQKKTDTIPSKINGLVGSMTMIAASSESLANRVFAIGVVWFRTKSSWLKC